MVAYKYTPDIYPNEVIAMPFDPFGHKYEYILCIVVFGIVLLGILCVCHSQRMFWLAKRDTHRLHVCLDVHMNIVPTVRQWKCLTHTYAHRLSNTQAA